MFKSALKTEARKDTRAKDITEIRAVTMNNGEDKTVKYVELEKKQTKENLKGSR